MRAFSIYFTFLLLLGTKTQAQTIPWFFSTPIFQEWKEANKVEGLIAKHREFESFNRYNDYLAKLDYQNNTDLSQVEAHYAFDSTGDLATVTISRKEIELWNSEYILKEEEYNQLCKEFEQLPYALSENNKEGCKPVKGLEHLNIRANWHRGTLLHNEGIILTGGMLPAFSDECSGYYHYQRLARFHFEKGLLQSYETYYPGGADTGNLPYYSKVWFDDETDSCSLLKVHAYFPEWDGEWGVNSVMRDTIVGFGFYRCEGEELVEGEVFEDSSGTLIYGSPYVRVCESQKGRKSISDVDVISFRHLHSRYDTYLNALFSGVRNRSFLEQFHSGDLHFSSDGCIMAHSDVKGKYQLIRKLDRKGNLKNELLYEFIRGKKMLIWEGEKTDSGYTYVLNKKRYGEKITYFRMKVDATFEIIQHQKVRKNLSKVDNRLIFIDGEIEAEESGSTNKVRYRVIYGE